MPKIIALSGTKGCGKDTVAKILIDAYYQPVDRRFRQIAFADPIKHEVMRIFDLKTIAEYDTFKRSIIQSNNVTIDGRHVVREIGMLMRNYNESQFVNYVNDKIASDKDSIWIVTDLRFDNELEYLKSCGAKIVKINRPQGNHVDVHITERGFDNDVCDIVLENKDTLAEFNLQVLKMFDQKLMEWNWI